MGSVVKRFRELGLEVEYIPLDPQYMDAFIERMREAARKYNSLKEIIRITGIRDDGTLEGVKPEKIYEPPDNLQKADVSIAYEELLPEILSKR